MYTGSFPEFASKELDSRKVAQLVRSVSGDSSMFKRRQRQSHEDIEGDRKGRDIALLAAGVTIGAGIALLLAPASGEEARYVIGRSYRRTMRRIGRHSQDLRERAEELLDRAQELRERGAHLLHFSQKESFRRRG